LEGTVRLTTGSVAGMAADLDPYRLPTDVTPTRYALELTPDMEAFTFAGTVAIAVDVHAATDRIVLNALELELDEAWVEAADGERVAATVTLDEPAERAHLALGRVLQPGAATLHIHFRGAINDKLHGFYRSTFKDDDGAEHVIATTQMEATYARKAFPCWDEPAHKAVFGTTLVVPEHLTALSNGAEVGREPAGDGKVRVTFADTIPMSTYLVAFVIGPLEITEAVDVGGVPVRIAHPPGKGHLAPYARDVAAACLAWFTEYYDFGYPGGKIDHVAIPDFAFGAMENQGCITYREVLLLVDPDKATTPELMNLVDVVNHETAHMWFGNLVTMKWWNGIWLNEAFATFMEMKATEAWRPDWQRFVEFGLSRTLAMDTDALDSTRPIEFHVESPEEAEGMFDILTYEKGGAILRMLEQYLGEDRFRDGVRRYLADNAYGNTENTDLWDAIEAVTGEPVRRIMDSWIFQGGHPIVTVEKRSDGKLRLHQERFRLSEAVDPDGGQHEDLGDVWAVPVKLRVGRADGSTEDIRIVLDSSEEVVDAGADVAWVMGNAGGEGAYRVHYADDLRAALVANGIGRLEVLERYGLLNDAHAATLNGSLPAEQLLDLTRAYAEETDVAVWKLLASVLDTLDRALPDDARPALAGRVRALAGPALRRLGFAPTEGEDDRTRSSASPRSSATTPKPAPRPSASGPPSSLSPAPSTPRSLPPPPSSPSTGTTTARRSSSATPVTARPTRRRRRCASSTPSAEPATRPASPRSSIARSPRSARRTRRTSSGSRSRTAPWARRRGSTSAATGTPSTSGSRRTRSSGCSRACAPSPTRRSPPTCRRSSPSTRCRRAPSSSPSTSSASRWASPSASATAIGWRRRSAEADHQQGLGEVVADDDRHRAPGPVAHEALPRDERVAPGEEAGADHRPQVAGAEGAQRHRRDHRDVGLHRHGELGLVAGLHRRRHPAPDGGHDDRDGHEADRQPGDLGALEQEAHDVGDVADQEAGQAGHEQVGAVAPGLAAGEHEEHVAEGGADEGHDQRRAGGTVGRLEDERGGDQERHAPGLGQVLQLLRAGVDGGPVEGGDGEEEREQQPGRRVHRPDHGRRRAAGATNE
jgi:puromycin-sensitive aminopeptidase